MKEQIRIFGAYPDRNRGGSVVWELIPIVIGVVQFIVWELSSAGSEHLPYKQRVGGSNPSAPTKKTLARTKVFFMVFTTPYLQYFLIES